MWELRPVLEKRDREMERERASERVRAIEKIIKQDDCDYIWIYWH
jgi:hypothetical protein